MASVLGMAIGVAMAIAAIAFAVAGGARVVSVSTTRIVVGSLFLVAGASTAGIARRSGRRCDGHCRARRAGAAACRTAFRRGRGLVAAVRSRGDRKSVV